MFRPAHYLRLLLAQLRLSALLSVQYRADFFVDGFTSVVWVFFNALPLFIAFQARTSIAGWTLDEALITMGLFTFLKGVMDGAINPSLTAVVEQVRKGTLDFTLLKPADAQFLVSTARFQPWKAMDAFAGLGLVAFALVRLHRFPELHSWLAAVGLVLAALLVLYSLWILTVSAAFFVVRVDNLAFLFASIFDLARWPVSIFRGAFRFLFTFVLPLAIMTTYPALALLGRLSAQVLGWAIFGTLAFAALARFAWNRSISEYTSASS